MFRKRPLRPLPSWPDRQLQWIERERTVVRWMHRGAGRPWVVGALNGVSRLGDGWMWYGVILALPWLDHVNGTTCAIRMVAVGLFNLLLYKLIKRATARQRPYQSCPGVRACAKSLDEHSFPSGHTLHSVAFALILAAYYPAMAYVVWPFTLLIAVSRVVLGLHYPTDVLAGAALGALTAAISFNLL